MSIIFNSAEKNLLVDKGKFEDERVRKYIRGALGITNKKVEATRHTILSGPPGVGKSHGTADECKIAGVNFIMIEAGISDLQLTLRLALAVHELQDDQELVVILDDADDVVFRDYDTLNKWKLATGDTNYDLGIIPHYHHAVSMLGTMSSLEKQGKMSLLFAVKRWQQPDQIGLSIPMDRVRFVILCNKDMENAKSFPPKMRSAIGPLMDRFSYKRLNLTHDDQWGWLAYVLGSSQPFEDEHLTDDQKKDLLDWMKSNWKNLRSQSYRTVRKLAAAMINDPINYEDQWNEELKGH